MTSVAALPSAYYKLSAFHPSWTWRLPPRKLRTWFQVFGAVSVLAYGRSDAAATSFQIIGTDMPPNVFGMAVMGEQYAPHLPSDEGLCIGNPLFRLAGQGQLFQTTSAGTSRVTIETGNIPSMNGMGLIQAGERFTFQLWHRDVVGTAGPWRFTQAISIDFR